VPLLVLLFVGISACSARASQISIPFFFVDGTVASAAEVNANFSALVNESNAQDLRIGAIEERLHLDLVPAEGEADPGDTDNAYLMVALNEVASLTLDDFFLTTALVPAGGATVAMTAIQYYPVTQVYRLTLNPAAGTWKAGRYLLGMRLNAGGSTVSAVVALDIF
jgi:hypothetical protein